MTVHDLLGRVSSMELTQWMALFEAEAAERREQQQPRQQLRGL